MQLRIEYIPLNKLKSYPRNPKLHDHLAINRSIKKFGFVDPIIIDENSGFIVAGHGRVEELLSMRDDEEESLPENVKDLGEDWAVPVVRGVSFEDEKLAESYLLTVNKLVELGGWDEGLLDEMVKELDPIGFSIEDVDADIDEAIESLDFPEYTGIIPTNSPDEAGVSPVKLTAEGLQNIPDSKGVSPDFDDIPGILSGAFSLEEDIIWDTKNNLGIPELLPEMILSEIPKPIKTWGGIKETPDDGHSYYLYSFGSTSSKGVPYSRAVICWWTSDSHIKTLLETPAYRVGQMLTAGVHAAVVPDVSLWQGNPKVLHMYACYQAQWMGRYFQEAGIKVIPRFEYFLPEAREFSLIGIPKNPPTLATQLHTGFQDEHIPRIKESLKLGLDILKPGQFLVYVSTKGENIINDIKGELATDEIIMLPTAKKVRRTESRAESDPYLKELRKRKRGWEGKQDAPTSG